MYRIALLEDDTLFANYLSNEISAYFSKLDSSVQIHHFSTGNELLSSTTPFDLYFLDILLPDGNGMDFSAQIQKRFGKQFIIFVTSNEASVFEAIHQSPFRFIRKEMLSAELPEACKSYLEKVAQTQQRKTILVKQKAAMIPISIASIQYMESKGHYINFHCTDDIYHIRGSFKDFPELCDSDDFGRSSQSFLIHLSYIKRASANELVLKKGEIIPISRSKRNSFKEKYLRYQRLIQDGDII